MSIQTEQWKPCHLKRKDLISLVTTTMILDLTCAALYSSILDGRGWEKGGVINLKI
jgi:hypothetical protein